MNRLAFVYYWMLVVATTCTSCARANASAADDDEDVSSFGEAVVQGAQERLETYEWSTFNFGGSFLLILLFLFLYGRHCKKGYERLKARFRQETENEAASVWQTSTLRPAPAALAPPRTVVAVPPVPVATVPVVGVSTTSTAAATASTTTAVVAK